MEHTHHTEEEHLEEMAAKREDPEEATTHEHVRTIKKEDKKEWMLPASILAAAIMISIALIYTTGAGNLKGVGSDKGRGQEVKHAPAVTAEEAVLGKADAKVTIIEYGDFQCPYCALFYKKFEPAIRKELIDAGIAKYVFRPFPIVDRIVGQGTESNDSANAFLCARDQGKSWEMHNALYDIEYNEMGLAQAKKIESSEGNGNLIKSLFAKIAGEKGMDVATFTSCYDSKKHAATIAAYEAGATEAGVQGTPSLFINGDAVDLSTYGTPDKFVQYVKSLAK
jgi:protein-disulfide isomerase